MSREEAMKAFIESGMELRRDDIELGRKLERERIIKLLEVEAHNYDNDGVPFSGAPIRYCIHLLKGEQK